MKCTDCAYNQNCSLQEIAEDITGCDGHSKTRELKDDECVCIYCGGIFLQSGRIFKQKDNHQKGICYDCY